MPGLAELPDDIVVVLLAKLLPSISRVATVTGKVCKTWLIPPERAEVWLRLATLSKVRMPIATGRGLRSERDLRRAFLRGAQRRTEVLLAETEAALTKLLQRLKRGEIPRRVLAQHFRCRGQCEEAASGQEQLQLAGKQVYDINHRLTLHSGRSIAYAAAWMGRLTTLKRLVCDFGASLDHEDDNGFTPLAVACWSGQNRVVTWILSSGYQFGDLDKKGVAPMTSSCGGKVLPPLCAMQCQYIVVLTVRRTCQGPFSPLDWVRRKRLEGWKHVERCLVRAGAGASDSQRDM